MTAKDVLTELFREGVPAEKMGLPEAAQTFVDLLDTITEEQAANLLDRAAFETAQALLLVSAGNLMERLTKTEQN